MSILVTGGCGYVGSVLAPKLLAAGHTVDVFDLQWFGNHLAPHANLSVLARDVREVDELAAYDAVIHLAAISNDTAGTLDPRLSWETNALATARLCDAAVRSGVRTFIYASSGSVYGVNESENVEEDARLVPLTDYNKTKMCAERIVISYASQMNAVVVRPGTVCGVSPRQRLDLVVNMFVAQAMANGVITVHGGAQSRSHVHIDDLTDLYLWLLENPTSDVYNAAFENMTVGDLALKVREATGAKVKVSKGDDTRSYRQNSEWIRTLGFEPKKTVDDAIGELRDAFSAHALKDDDAHYNLRAMPACAYA